MKATWRLLTFLSIFLAFANNLIAQGGGEQILYLNEGNITIYSDGYQIGGAEKVAANGPYTITQNNPATRINKTITVSSDVTAEIILDGVNIYATNPFDAKLAKEVTLILRGENKIESRGGESAVSCPVKEGTKLTIKKDDVQGGSLTANGYKPYDNRTGSAGIGFNANGQLIKGSIFIESGIITATGGPSSAGIGLYTMSYNQKGGTIHIKGGTITAKGGIDAAGIGSSAYGGNTTILIEGGTIEATGGNGGAGIGAGYGSNRYSGTTTICINGGTITAKGGSNAAGIGGGSDKGGEITITGGKITATGGTSAADIGAGNGGGGYAISISGGLINAQNAGIGNYSVAADKTPSTFLTGDAGKAIIFAKKISDQSDKEHWFGLIFENENGKIYGGSTYEVNQDVTIPVDHTLIIEEGVLPQKKLTRRVNKICGNLQVRNEISITKK